MTGRVIWGDFTSALRRRDETLLKGETEAFGDDCPGMITLGGYIDGSIYGPTKKAVEEHLAECPLCRRLTVELYMLLKVKPVQPPAPLKGFLLGLVPGAEAIGGESA